MINRCKNCDEPCPDFSELCDCCYFIEINDNPEFVSNELDALQYGQEIENEEF